MLRFFSFFSFLHVTKLNNGMCKGPVEAKPQTTSIFNDSAYRYVITLFAKHYLSLRQILLINHDSRTHFKKFNCFYLKNSIFKKIPVTSISISAGSKSPKTFFSPFSKVSRSWRVSMSFCVTCPVLTLSSNCSLSCFVL